MLRTHADLIAHKWAKVTCTINWAKITDARIQVENDQVFICQNLHSWSPCTDKLWYEDSWTISNTWSKYEKFHRYCINICLAEEPKKQEFTYQTIIRRDDGLEFTEDKIGNETLQEITDRRKKLLIEANQITGLLRKHKSLTF